MLNKTKIGKNLAELNKKRSIKTTPPLMDKWVLLFGLITFLVVVAPIGYLIAQSINRPPRDLRIDIKNKNNPHAGNFIVDECDNCSELIIRDKKGEPVFEESLKSSEDNRLRKYLINKATEGDKPNTSIKLFGNQFPNRLVDVSFDISNSVIYRDNESLKNKANIKYSDFVFQKFKEYMLNNQGILPRNKINIRFYGPELKDNPCNNKLVIKYTEPEWEANITYSRRNEQILIEIGDKLEPKTERNGLEIVTNNPDEIYNIIYDFYSKGIANPNQGCHFGTYLIPHLIEISDDIVNEKYSGNEEYSYREFVLVTDGEFYLRDDEVTGGKEVYATPKNYDVLKRYLEKRTNKGFSVNGSTICKKPDDKFIIVGMEYDNNLSYRNLVQQFYKELLNPCQVIFENF
ncbi:MAG: hypothetical protein Q7R77_00945 [Candidatus Daviesbacteria bacterium]|nr:hypothetical protein [Candidatus Daviesbacteria bacterium]